MTGAAMAVAAGLILAAPVVGQDAGPNRDAPKSLLPPGFDTPAPAPAAAPAPLLPGANAPPAETAAAPAAPSLVPDQVGDVPPPYVAAPAAPALPPGAPIGILDAANGGLPADAFSGSNGRFLAGLANRIKGPIASRWAAITVGRALASRVPGPAGLGDGDWVAARAGLLMRMGAIDPARRLIDVLPSERYTPATYQVAGEVSLAAADLAGLCPIAATGRALSDDVMWDLAWGMCAAMDGDDITAAGVIDSVRNKRGAVPAFDLRLAQRVVVLAGGAGRADGINWAEEEGLSPYRYGVASAAGVTVPADRLAALGPAHPGWVVRNAGMPAATRLALLRQAAVLGTLSAEELASGVAALSPADASGGFAADSRAGRLRDAFTGSAADRADVIAAIVRDDGADHYGALLEAATAAAALKPAAALADQSDVIIAALLAAGNAARARAWWPVAQQADADVRARALALLATGAGVPMASGDVGDWRSAAKASPRREAMLVAALSGLGQARGGSWNRDGIKPVSNRWTAALASAAKRRAVGEVALLAATGLQGGWADVPPAHVQAIIAALVACGQMAPARLIAAEAVTRTA
ncbi:hypothetical protein [Sandarakinorhabdus sp. AAP62]|uniref:hypothetical protein n=1 Tax=Sandarakinorhabdus sp. AAP62 TaxID=1248916 RepID=UPI00126703A0|nr:hypothetical protein [Sandarakinorhabdus sp. AAP62]